MEENLLHDINSFIAFKNETFSKVLINVILHMAKQSESLLLVSLHPQILDHVVDK